MPNYKNVYITIGDFAILQGLGRPYEGFVIGLGYAYMVRDNIPPPNQHGFTHYDAVPYSFNTYLLISNQVVDNSPEMIELSMSGITPAGALLYTVQHGDTLSQIAQKHRVTIANLISWNKIDNPDKIQAGQKLVVSEKSTDLLKDYLSGRRIDSQFTRGSGTSPSDSNIRALDIIDNIASALSITSSTYGILPKTQLYNQVHQNGQFAYIKNGEVVIRSNKYYGNQNQSAAVVSGLKNNFGQTIKINRGVALGGVGASALTLGIDVYDASQGNVNEYTALDIGVGTAGVTAGAASYFSGITIPYVGEFVLFYGAWRFGWDMGEKYGPSKWPKMYRDYKERKENERFLKVLQQRLERQENENNN